ncbi:MAG: SpoIIE family protein phosphatase [Chloroflexota bacterium]
MTIATAAEGVARTRVLIVDDQRIVAEAVRRMLVPETDLELTWCGDGTQAVAKALELRPDVILQDLVMPDVDGLEVVTALRSEPALATVPLIVLSSKEEPAVKAESFARGASDYLVKLPDRIELVARIRHHAAGYRARQERDAAWAALRSELDNAAAYVRSLLPAPMGPPISAAWRFEASSSLGGDALGFHWLDPDHFAVYVVDVCGHGVGAALLSVSVLNVLNARTLPGVDFRHPAEVLAGLNAAFPMERQHGMFFTIWYGVFHAAQRRLDYAAAAHPAAILLAPGEGARTLGQPNLPIGVMEGLTWATASAHVPPGSRLVVLSDGAFEVQVAAEEGRAFAFTEFVDLVAAAPGDGPGERAEAIIASVQSIAGRPEFDDDCTLLELVLD